MKKIWRKVMGATLAVVMLMVSSPINVEASNEKEKIEYEIYPTVQEMKYEDTVFEFPHHVQLVMSESLDDATVNHVQRILNASGISATVSNEIVGNDYHVLVGTNASDDVIKSYFEKNLNTPQSLFDEKDSYLLSVTNQATVIIGKDTDAAFFGATTLELILEQLKDNQARSVSISDYSNTTLRGFIEGYYGIPWSFEDRESLMRFGSRFKMNSYLFAPKDDPYHNSKWRVPYPEEELAKIRHLAQVGNETKTRFVWTIHPFMNNGVNFSEEKYQEDLGVIIEKFETLYDAGVRQFGILADDVWNVTAMNQKKLTTDLNEWNKTKVGNYNLIFVPSDYNTAWSGDGSNLKILNTMPDEVHIMWTGDSVLGHVNQKTIDNFQRLLTSPEKKGRNPYFWLNWPVNDVNNKRLIMGPGEMLHKGIKDLDGVASNPMQQAEASKTSLFAVADYSWNTVDFDKDKSWEQSFKYIDANAGSDLLTVSKHMQDPAPNGHGLVLPESEEIKPKLDAFKTKYQGGNDYELLALELIEEFQEIADAAQNFQLKSKNVKLVAEIKPWLDSLSEQSLATVYFLKTALALDTSNVNDVWENYSEGLALHEKSKNHLVKNLTSMNKVEAGYKRLIPFVNFLNDDLSPKVNAIMNGKEEKQLPTVYTNYTQNEIYDGKLNNMIDANDTSFVWFGRYIKKDDYVGIKYEKPTHVSSIRILPGTPTKPEDTFYKAVLEYSLDEKTWTPVNDVEYGPYSTEIIVNNCNFEAKYIRLRTTVVKSEEEKNPKWAAFREFSINGVNEEITFESTVIKSPDFVSVYQGEEKNLIDANDSTLVWYKTKDDNVKKGGYIGLDLGKVIPLGKIRLLQGTDTSTDMLTSTYLEISQNGKDWEKVSDVYKNNKEIIIDLSLENKNAQYIRFVSDTDTNKWAIFRELTVKTPEKPTKVFTNQSSLADLEATFLSSSFEIKPTAIKLESQKYIGIDLGRIRELSRVDNQMASDLGVSIVAGKNMDELSDYQDAKDIRYIIIKNPTEKTISFDLEKFLIETNEIEEIKIKETNYSGYENIKAAFDGDRTSQAWFKQNQTEGKYITYDLGQTINLNHIKMVVHDSEIDYMRNGKISVSTDNITFHDVLTIGDGTEASIGSVYPNHEVSYLTKEADGFAFDTRFIKIEVTKTLSINKWLRFAEIELNHGMHLEKINDPTFETNPKALHGFGPENMFDNNFQTAFQSSEASGPGYVNYHLSDNKIINEITILQSKNTASNALVNIRVANNEWIELGRLSQGFNKFVLDEAKVFYELKVSWRDGDISPIIYEVYFDLHEQPALNFTDLDKKITEIDALVAKHYSQTSWQHLADEVAIAKKLKGNETTTQEIIEQTLAQLSEKITALVNINELSLKISEANEVEQSLYTEESYQIFLNAISEATKSYEKTDVTSEEVELAIKQLAIAKEQLKLIDDIDKNNLEEKIAEAKMIELSNYTEETYQILQEAIIAAEAMIDSETASQDDINKATIALQEAIDGLVLETEVVDKSELIKLVDIAKAILDLQYTEESYSNLQSVITEAETVLNDADATLETVDAMMITLNDAIEQLEMKPGVTDKRKLQIIIDEVNALEEDLYTIESFQNLLGVLAFAEQVNIDEEALQTSVDEAYDRLQESMNQLVVKPTEVDKEQLGAIIEEAKLIVKENYSKESYQLLQEAIEYAETVYANMESTEIEVIAAIDLIALRIENLEEVKIELPKVTYNKIVKMFVDEKTTEADFVKMLDIKSDRNFTVITNFSDIVSLNEPGVFDVQIQITFDNSKKRSADIIDVIQVKTVLKDSEKLPSPSEVPNNEKLVATGYSNRIEMIGIILMTLSSIAIFFQKKYLK